jgi:hypothetical protein
LTSVTFAGNAPASFGTSVFSFTAPSFTIYYSPGASGFTTPTWQGYPALPRTAQTLTFAQPADHTYGDVPFALTATASSGLPVSFALISGPASLAGSTLTLTSSGIVTIRATQAGDATWAPATPEERSFTVNPPSPFLAFLAAAGVPSNQRAATDDPDADGIVNLLEFALGLAPMTPDSTGLPTISSNAGDLTLTYTRAQPSAVTYSVQTTTDLTTPASWTATGVTQGTPDANGLTTASVPLDDPRFLRLGVTLNP